jgi:DNA-binding MarR family transcriptional regulator
MNRTDRLNDTHISHTALKALLKSNVALETHGLSLKSLQAFLTLACEHSFTKAAKELNLTQSGLSRIIGSLENEVGEQLFYRSSQLVRLTVAGEGLVPHAKHLVHC